MIQPVPIIVPIHQNHSGVPRSNQELGFIFIGIFIFMVWLMFWMKLVLDNVINEWLGMFIAIGLPLLAAGLILIFI